MCWNGLKRVGMGENFQDWVKWARMGESDLEWRKVGEWVKVGGSR